MEESLNSEMLIEKHDNRSRSFVYFMTKRTRNLVHMTSTAFPPRTPQTPNDKPKVITRNSTLVADIETSLIRRMKERVEIST